MANIKIEYASSSALTITLASLASDSGLVIGRQSTEVSNTTNKYIDYLLGGKITTGTSPTTSKLIEVRVAALVDDSTYPDTFSTADAARTLTSADIKNSCTRLAAAMVTSNSSDTTYWFGPVSVSAMFGGSMPKKFVVWVVHNTGVNLNSTGSNHAISITPVYMTSI